MIGIKNTNEIEACGPGDFTKWFNDYWIAVVHDTELDDARACSRWRKPSALEECIVRLSEELAIHYFNVTDSGGEVLDLAADVARRSTTL